ncbi:MAG TPA: MBL fold metallo-hydrolase [Chloroflexota bacterium]|nr:MBL fold metallo-hydrolase [Chloroflexota bacterium]
MPDLHPSVSRLVLGPLQTNCYFITCPETGESLVIDPADDAERIAGAVKGSGGTIRQILLTHVHPDHIGGLLGLRDRTGARLMVHQLDVQLLQSQGGFFGVRPADVAKMAPDQQLQGGEEITVGHLTGSIIHTPGHTPGGITLRMGNLLFTGDTLFAQGVGRVDLPGGSLDALMNSIRGLFTLPDDCVVYPGHGPSSTIGTEKRDNPYV